MEKRFQNIPKEKKGVSLNLDKEFLKTIDELAKLTKTSRSIVIESIIGQGTYPFVKFLENTWKGYLAKKKWDRKTIKNLLRELKKIKVSHFWLHRNPIK